MDQLSILETLRKEAIESLSRNDQVDSTIPGIEYVKPGEKKGEHKICVATYSRKVDSLLPKTVEIGGVPYRISIISSDLFDSEVQLVPMSTFDEKE